VVPLPQGAIADSAKATFNNGVLEIVVQAPSFDVRRGRRVEIKEAASEQKSNQQGPKT
jgi:HSP20 family molecular chaperone IbpA